jgi:hypothetical protein
LIRGLLRDWLVEIIGGFYYHFLTSVMLLRHLWLFIYIFTISITDCFFIFMCIFSCSKIRFSDWLMFCPCLLGAFYILLLPYTDSLHQVQNRIGGVMVSVLTSSTVDRGFEPLLCQTKEYKIGICCFSTKHAALRSKNKDWLAPNHNNVSKWSNMSTCGLLFQWASTLKIQLSMLV